jgi:hypothetical protein
VSGKADTLEPAASALGTTLENAVAAIRNHMKTGQALHLLLVGSADKFELEAPLRAEFGSNTGLARARAEWVGGRISQVQTKDLPGYLALTVGPSKHGGGLSLTDTRPDRGVAIYGAFLNKP